MKRLILIAAVILFLSCNVMADSSVDIQKFVQETQQLDQGADNFRLVWWIPTEYWMESFRNAPNLGEDQKQEFYKAVDDYIVICLVDAKVSSFGSVTPTPRTQVIQKLSLSIGNGKKMKPLPDSKISADAKNLFAMMKPVLANMLGQFGQGMEFVCFNGIDSKKNKLIGPKKKGSFSVYFDKSSYNWRLPLGSLLPPKYDAKTGEEFPGNYLYNPFTGKKLISKP